ncbi:alcohol acetyltransferase-domain-containing protein [Roridomyces roridus]|uniref:Alcohol acetyltransferase-domain-containing protein n=1 Tax=Roridomyces roridus TaxID=1738132 RepID=A0AAD7FH71_9AGAR|nr:alcohol acetyltransferase-domain-containing protein [Roridomyces roridus]
MERFHITKAFLGLDTVILASAQYTTQDGTVLTPETLFPALRNLIESQAPLGLQTMGDEATANVSWVRLPSVDLSRVVEFSGERELADAYESQLARPIKTQTALPLWRVEVLADNTLIFANHHAICDGESLLSFHMLLLRALQETSTSTSVDASPVVMVPDTTLLIPPVEQLVDVRPSFLRTVQELYEHFAPASWRPARFAWSGHPTPFKPPPQINTHIRFLTLPSAESSQLLAACRAHGATITSVLYVLAINVLSRLLQCDPLMRYKHIATITAISLRGAANLPREAIIDYPSSRTTYPRLDPIFSWADAARESRELASMKTSTAKTVGMLRWLFGQYVPFMQEKLGTRREAGFTMSNIGRFETPDVKGRWSVGRTVFAQSDVIVGHALTFSLTGDPSGALNFSFGWTDSSVDTPFVEQFIEGLREAILEII